VRSRSFLTNSKQKRNHERERSGIFDTNTYKKIVLVYTSFGLSDLLCIYMTKLLQSDLLRGVELFHSSDDFRQKSNMEGEIYLV
jgi:hypothetical protein